MTDQEFEDLKEEKRQNKRLIKNSGFKVCTVKRTYRLFDANGTLVSQKPTYYGEMEALKYFASIINIVKPWNNTLTQ
jgi:hypothetical protein